jgi:hypothetical protein
LRSHDRDTYFQLHGTIASEICNRLKSVPPSISPSVLPCALPNLSILLFFPKLRLSLTALDVELKRIPEFPAIWVSFPYSYYHAIQNEIHSCRNYNSIPLDSSSNRTSCALDRAETYPDLSRWVLIIFISLRYHGPDIWTAESLLKRDITIGSQNATLTVPYGSTSTSNVPSSNSGLSESDKIALATGIGIGVPAALFGLIGACYTWKAYRRRHARALPSVGVSKTVAGSRDQVQGFSDQTPEIDSRPGRSLIAELAITTHWCRLKRHKCKLERNRGTACKCERCLTLHLVNPTKFSGVHEASSVNGRDGCLKLCMCEEPLLASSGNARAYRQWHWWLAAG